MVKKWAAEFIHGKESLESDARPERPVTVTRQETIAKIHDIIMADRQFLGSDLRQTRLNMSRENRVMF